MAITLLRHFHRRRKPPSPTPLPPVAASGSHHDFAGGCGLDQHATSVTPTTSREYQGSRLGGAKTRGGRRYQRGSTGCEKAGENGGPGAEERTGGQHPRQKPTPQINIVPTTVYRRTCLVSLE